MAKGETKLFFVDGRTREAGAAATRAYRDLIVLLGQEKAEAVMQEGYQTWMPIVRQRRAQWPKMRGVEKLDIVVEAVLLAAGVPEEEVARLAGRYREKRSRSAQSHLARFARRS